MPLGHLWCWGGENITFRSGGQYQCATTRLPVQVALLADEDADIIEISHARLANPGKRTRVSLDDIVDV
ncbi:hypothetical protein [Cedecea sp.]|uniref:hypothetical protein n=1 Tax=Cedecea sp. TaxID=1970739 RepID=UPI002F4249D3